MEVFILLHSDAYEAGDGKIIACSLFRENLTERMNCLAVKENQKIMELVHHREIAHNRFYVYNDQEDNWAKWNGRKCIEKLSIECFEMS